MAHAALVVIWQAMRLTAGDRWWWLALANALSLYLLLPAPLLWLLSLVTRRWAGLAAASVPLAVLSLLYGGLFLPPDRRAGDVAPESRLRVMTFNSLGRTVDGAPAERAIRAAAPDVICLQELNSRLADDLAIRLEADYPYYVAPAPGTRPRVGIFSRFPLRDEGEIVDRAERHGARAASFDWQGRSVLVLSAHSAQFGLFSSARAGDPSQIESGARIRADQVRLWLERMAQHDGPAVLCGDLNLTDQNEAYRLLAAELQDSFRQAGWGFGHTFPATAGRVRFVPTPGRLLRLDYVWATPHWEVLDAQVADWDGQSDHLPVIADLALACGPEEAREVTS